MNNDMAAVLERARRQVKLARADASLEKQEAFARSVAWLTMGWAVDGNWPSIRELAIRRTYCVGGCFSYETACNILLAENGLIFGPLRQIHRDAFEEELSGGNDPKDLRVLTSSNG